jgi:hypothetical protein
MRKSLVIGSLAAVLVLLLSTLAWAASESLVTNGSPPNPFPQNKQNEPSVAIDPSNPEVLAAGANEEVDQPPCDGNSCPFAPGIGTSGVYFSFDGGSTWTQPTYQGWSGRTGTLGVGPIGTLPNYYENGLLSDGDPTLAFGPAPGAHGFSWDNGSRLYYGNLSANFASRRKDFAFKGVESIAVSYADDLESAAAGENSAWSQPVVVTQEAQSSSTFSDKPTLGADNAASSPYFGNVYVCYSHFQSIGSEPNRIAVTRSTNGGATWAKPVRLTESYNSRGAGGRQGCQVATDSKGVVYVVWEDTVQHQGVFRMSRSFNGGVSFEKPRVVAYVTDVGIFDGVRSISFDGIAGARTGSFPSLSIANGAPSGENAPDTVAIGWSDGADGLNHEHALVQLSDDQGSHWTSTTTAEQSGDRPDFAFIGISPDGSDLYVVYDGFLDPFRNDETSSRRFQGVVRHATVDGADLGAFSTVDRGQVGDARASSANALIDEFLGDYNTVVATNDGAVAVFNSAENGEVCSAINDYRQAIVDGTAGAAPAPGTDCPATFGNTDIIAAVV